MAPQKPTLWLRVSVFGLIWLCVLAVQPVGADPASEISRIMEAHFQAGEFNGSVLVARGERIIYQRGLGFANLEWKVPNDPYTKFELGSITKQFTALLVLQFVNEGKVTFRTLIVLLDNTDSPKLPDIALAIRRVLAAQ